jgi:hypothetical protein
MANRVLVQLDVAVFGQYLLELHDFILKLGAQVVAEMVRVNVIVAIITRAQAEAIMLLNRSQQLLDVNTPFVLPVTAHVVDLNVMDVSDVPVTSPGLI